MVTKRNVLLFALAGCGGLEGTFDDPFNGAVGASAFDSRFAPVSRTSIGQNPDKSPIYNCDASSCYATQSVRSQGQLAELYNVGVYTLGDLLELKEGAYRWKSAVQTGVGKAYRFDECQGEPSTDPVKTQFATDVQFPVFTKLPLAVNRPPLPFIQVFETSSTYLGCNAIKDASSIGAANALPGKYGAQAGESSFLALWTPISTTARPNKRDDFLVDYFWYEGLIGAYLKGDVIESTDTTPKVQRGILLQVGTTAPKGTENNVILTEFLPGQPGYSPVVLLWTKVIPADAKVTQYTSICFDADACGDRTDAMLFPSGKETPSRVVFFTSRDGNRGNP